MKVTLITKVRELRGALAAGGSRYFLSYLLRTTTSLLAAGTAGAFYLSQWAALAPGRLTCRVDGVWYQCAGHQAELYQAVTGGVLGLLGLHLLLNLYNLAWLLLPGLTRLGRIIAAHRAAAGTAEPGQIEHFYHRNR